MVKALKMHYCKGFDKKKLLLHENTQSAIRHTPYFQWVVN